MSIEDARALIRRVFESSEATVLEGAEKAEVLTMLLLLDPLHESNNQRTFTVTYEHGEYYYDITYGLEDDPVIERYKPIPE